MPIIEIEVKNKIAKSPEARIVCGNSDFEIKFAFDEEWAAHNVKTARFAYNGTYEDVVFNGDTCSVPIIRNTTVCMVGVYAGDLHTTTPALVLCHKSIICGDGVPADPQPDVYQQIMAMIDAGMLQGPPGEKGEPGYTPQKGVDYFDGEPGPQGDPFTFDDFTEEQLESLGFANKVLLSINNGISVIDTGLTYTRGLVEVIKMGDVLWVCDSGVYNFTNSFKTTNNRTVLQFDLPKALSNKLPNVNGVYGGTGTIGYFPALAYENVTYTTFNCQSYLKRSAIGTDSDTFQLVYTGLSAVNGGGMCGFHLKMPLLLVDRSE